jgi:predicted dehydrogenase
MGGVDYPIGYVRWTEQRNFAACLTLLERGQLDLGVLTTRRVPFAQALDVYAELTRETNRDVGVVLEYPRSGAVVEGTEAETDTRVAPAAGSPTPVPGAQPVKRLDVIGAGNFARTMLLPHLKGQIPLGTVVNQTALSARHVREKFGFRAAATDAGPVLAEAGEAAVLIATRHHLHAPWVMAALDAGRHVFVEKPLCLTAGELEAIDQRVAAGRGSLMVGFNRRFAPASAELKRVLAAAPGPKTAAFRVMAGRLDPQHWYANLDESGGRVVGEACHFLDYFCFLFGSSPARVTAQTAWPIEGRLPFPDTVTAQVEFTDGSCGQLIYTAEGDSSYPKERLTVYGAGVVAELENFQQLAVHRGRRRKRTRYASKGHAEEMAAWLCYLRGTAGHPLPYDLARTSMRLTFAVLESIQRGRGIDLATAPPSRVGRV